MDTSQPLASTNPQINVVLSLFMTVLVSAVVTTTFLVNDNDTNILRSAVISFFSGDFEYESNIGRAESGEAFTFMNPPQSLVLLAPFAYFGPRWNAFWNVVFILLLLNQDPSRLYNTLSKMLLVITPPLLFVIASANFSGVATGLGLLILLNRRKGIPRGIAWAFLLARPQDSLLILLYELIDSLRTRDIRAYLSCAALLAIPALAYNPMIYIDWLASPASSGRPPHLTHWIPFLLNVVAVLIFLFLRFNHGRTWRSFFQMPLLERYWILIVVGTVLGPYSAFYMRWLILLPVRAFGPTRTLLTIGFVVATGAFTYTNLHNYVLAQTGMVLWALFLAIITPKETESQTVQPNFT